METNKPTSSQSAPPAKQTLSGLLSMPSVKNRFEQILGKKAEGFTSSIMNVVNSNKMLAEAEPNSIILSAAIAATLDLPVNSNLGFAHIVPYRGNGTVSAQFQMGWKGYVQLANRTGQYKTINVTEIYAGQLKGSNPVTGEYEWDFNAPASKEVIGYCAYFKMNSGMEKTIYWNVGKVMDHAKKYSQAYKKNYGPWVDNFDAMARKTLVKHIISNWGIMSVEYQRAAQFDGAVVRENENKELIPDYADNATSTDPAPATTTANTSNIPNAEELI
jgi:recombination protein RecT